MKVTGDGRIGEIIGGLREVIWSSRDIGPRDVNLGPIEVRNESSLKTTKVLQHEAAMLSKIQRSFSFFPFGILCKQYLELLYRIFTLFLSFLSVLIDFVCIHGAQQQ